MDELRWILHPYIHVFGRELTSLEHHGDDGRPMEVEPLLAGFPSVQVREGQHGQLVHFGFPIIGEGRYQQQHKAFEEGDGVPTQEVLGVSLVVLEVGVMLDEAIYDLGCPVLELEDALRGMGSEFEVQDLLEEDEPHMQGVTHLQIRGKITVGGRSKHLEHQQQNLCCLVVEALEQFLGKLLEGRKHHSHDLEQPALFLHHTVRVYAH